MANDNSRKFKHNQIPVSYTHLDVYKRQHTHTHTRESGPAFVRIRHRCETYIRCLRCFGYSSCNLSVGDLQFIVPHHFVPNKDLNSR